MMASRKPTTQIIAKRSPARLLRDRDDEFQGMLRNACLKAAGVGALSALAGVIPGTGILLRFALGEIADMAALNAIQEKLIEDTLALYELPLPEPLRTPLIRQISALGAGASVSVDALGRRLLSRFGSKLGGKVLGPVLGRIAPVAAVLTSALGNAAMTYAIGRRAQAFAKLGEAPVTSLSEAIRAFTGVDERKLWNWSVTATKDALGSVGSVLSRVAKLNPFGTKASGPDSESAEKATKPRRTARNTQTRKSAAGTRAAPAAPKRARRKKGSEPKTTE
ncbi:MAG: hypothetical protein ABI411_07675 [Tahibacter sp.]